MMIDWSSITFESESVELTHEKRLFLATAPLCALRRDFLRRRNDGLDLVNRAHAIDEDLEDFVSRLPCEFAYITRKIGKSDDAFLDYYHVYPDLWVTGLWNMYRCARILAHEIILERIDSHSMMNISLKAQCEKSEVMIAQLSDDIAASVPFYLNGDHLRESSSYSPKAGMLGQSLLWPLFVIGRVCKPSSSMRIWVVHQMEKIAQITGVQQNISVANLLKKWLGEKMI